MRKLAGAQCSLLDKFDSDSDCTKEEEMFPFTELPLEIRVHVLCFVEAPDLLNLSLVDRQLNELINRSNILWKPACYNKV